MVAITAVASFREGRGPSSVHPLLTGLMRQNPDELAASQELMEQALASNTRHKDRQLAMALLSVVVSGPLTCPTDGLSMPTPYLGVYLQVCGPSGLASVVPATATGDAGAIHPQPLQLVMWGRPQGCLCTQCCYIPRGQEGQSPRI